MTNPPCPRCGKECQPTDKDPVTYRCNAPKSDARQITAEDVKEFLAWRKSKGFDPGTTLYTDRVILHNFFNRLKIDNPVKEAPKLPKFRKRPVAYADAELKRFFRVCDDWERVFFLPRPRDRTSPRRTPDARMGGYRHRA